MRFEGLLDRQTRGEITQEEAATVLGVSVRTFQRWAERYEEDGADGLKDGRLNRPSPKRAPREELERMLCLFRDKYSDFTVKHFHEQLVKRHSYYLGYTVTKLTLHAAGLVRPAKKRSAHRKKRPRRPVPGMMLHQDGSRHAWLEGQPQLDLIVTMDDSTSEIRVRMRLFGSKGELRGALLDNGDSVRIGPKEAVHVAELLRPGMALAARGEGLESRYGRVVSAAEIGPDLARLRPRRGRPRAEAEEEGTRRCAESTCGRRRRVTSTRWWRWGYPHRLECQRARGRKWASAVIARY
jgi:transposase